jgi:hypothetical protein
LVDGERHRWRRVTLLAMAGVAGEIALYVLAKHAPAMAGLIRPLYVTLAAVLAYQIWHAAQRRQGHDRRQVDRRASPPSDTAS